MKDHTTKNLIEQIKKISLTPKEKVRIFDVLDWYAETNSSVKSPYLFSRPFAYVTASILVVILASGGTVFASEQALPGDILYPVKIHVSEPLKVALAVGADAKQQVQVAQVEERIKEAETLAVQDRLASSTSVDIQSAIKSGISEIKTQLSDKNKDALDVALSAHVRILQSIKDHAPQDQKSHVDSIQAAVEQDQVDTMNTNQGRHNGSSFNDRKSKIQGVIRSVDQKIVDSGVSISSTASSSASSTASSFIQDIVNNASGSIQSAQSNLDQAESAFNNGGDDNQADVLIDTSERQAQVGAITIDQGLQLGKLKNGDNGQGNGHGKGNAGNNGNGGNGNGKGNR
jgi:hypothetical protein